MEASAISSPRPARRRRRQERQRRHRRRLRLRPRRHRPRHRHRLRRRQGHRGHGPPARGRRHGAHHDVPRHRLHRGARPDRLRGLHPPRSPEPDRASRPTVNIVDGADVLTAVVTSSGSASRSTSRVHRASVPKRRRGGSAARERPSPIAPERKELSWGAGAFVVSPPMRLFLFPQGSRRAWTPATTDPGRPRAGRAHPRQRPKPRWPTTRPSWPRCGPRRQHASTPLANARSGAPSGSAEVNAAIADSARRLPPRPSGQAGGPRQVEDGRRRRRRPCSSSWRSGRRPIRDVVRGAVGRGHERGGSA